MKEAQDAKHRHLELKISEASNATNKLQVNLLNHTAAIHNKLDTATSKIRALDNANLEGIKKNVKIEKEVKQLESTLLKTSNELAV